MLRSSKPVRLFAAEHRRLNAIRPSEPPLAGLIDRPIAVRGDGKQAAAALNHRIPTVRSRWPHKGNASHAGGLGEGSDPFSAPQRVLPHPRPANTSHVVQFPGGGNCSDLAFDAQSHSSAWAMLLKALIAAPQREQDRRSPRRLAGCRPWRTGDQARLPRHHARRSRQGRTS